MVASDALATTCSIICKKCVGVVAARATTAADPGKMLKKVRESDDWSRGSRVASRALHGSLVVASGHQAAHRPCTYCTRHVHTALSRTFFLPFENKTLGCRPRSRHGARLMAARVACLGVWAVGAIAKHRSRKINAPFVFGGTRVDWGCGRINCARNDVQHHLQQVCGGRGRPRHHGGRPPEKVEKVRELDDWTRGLRVASRTLRGQLMVTRGRQAAHNRRFDVEQHV